MQERQFLTKLIDLAETSGFGHRWLKRPGLVGGVRVVSPLLLRLKEPAGLSLCHVVAALSQEVLCAAC